MSTADRDFKLTYQVDRVPDLMFGLTEDARVVMMTAADQIHITDPAQQSSIQLVLEQIRVDQSRLHRELHPPEPGSRQWAFEQLRGLGASIVMANLVLNRAKAMGEHPARMPDDSLVRVTYDGDHDGLHGYQVHAGGDDR
jgi:hypothetical protein